MDGLKNDQVNTTSGKTPAIDTRNHAKTCWLLSKDLDGPIIAGSSTKIEAKFVTIAARPQTPFVGLRLEFPLGVGKDKQLDNEAAGFGVRHRADFHQNAHPLPLIPHNVHEITLQFPRDRFTYALQPVPEDLRRRFAATGHPTVAKIKLNEGEKVRVLGWGKPFANKSDSEVEAWVNDNKPIVDDITLLGITRQTEFLLVVANEQKSLGISLSGVSLPPAFNYGYGKPRPWDKEEYTELWRENLSSERFKPAYSFDNIDDFLTVATQAPAQDVLWVHEAACDIREYRFPAYAVPDPDHDGVYYIVIRLTKHFRERFGSAWARLAKEQAIGVVFVKEQEGSQDGARSDKDVAKWNCKIMTYPQGIDHLANHPADFPDLVVRGYCRDETSESVKALKTFPSRAAAAEALKRVIDSAGLYGGEQPTNFNAWWDGKEESKPAMTKTLSERKALHVATLLGNGFYEWMVGGQDQRELPVVNFTDVSDTKLMDAIIDEALLADRDRFRAYMSHRYLGLGMITAGPGFGKTTALAAAALAMWAKLGQILCSAPSNVAIDNLAERLDRASRSVTSRYNSSKREEDTSCRRYPLVVRGYKLDEECVAFMHLLRNPDEEDMGFLSRRAFRPSKWQPPLSVACWLLAVVGSKAKCVRALHPRAKAALHEMRTKLQREVVWKEVFAVARGDRGYGIFEMQEQQAKKVGVKVTLKSYISAALAEIVLHADFLCVTSSMSHSQYPYQQYKSSAAKGIVVDEAANMQRGDLFCLWGNTLLPCFLGGDPKQLPPTVISESEKDKDGKWIHRFAHDGKISAMGMLIAAGYPVYRLKVQLRMANGLFDWISNTIYPDVPFTYADSCNVDKPQFAISHELEDFIQMKYPDIERPPKGKILPVFIDCVGSIVKQDQSGSKRSRDQVKVGLDFAAGFVNSKRIDPAKITILAPYKANVELIGRELEKPEYACLKGLPPASTIDGFQGQENDVIIVVMGTRFPKPGCGFTATPSRLNVLCTRQRCGLVIVGDINIKGLKDKNDVKKTKAILTTDQDGNIVYMKPTALLKIYREFYNHKRVAREVVREVPEPKADPKDKGKGKGKGKDKVTGKTEQAKKEVEEKEVEEKEVEEKEAEQKEAEKKEAGEMINEFCRKRKRTPTDQ